EAFFDPVSKKGYITTRLRTIFRERKKKSIPLPSTASTSTSSAVNDGAAIQLTPTELEDKINFLKFATPDQKRDIVEKTKETFFDRNQYRQANLCEKYPRFVDTNGLISLEFSLMFPNIEEDCLIKSFKNHVPIIKEVYVKTVTVPDVTLIPGENNWDNTTLALITLVHLNPGQIKKRLTVNAAVSHLIIFQNCEEPLEGILTQKPTTQRFILAVGTSKATISKCYVVFDKYIIATGNDIIAAFDVCFKAHYAFNLKFDLYLERFYELINELF
ncbi:hypothetical protein PPYR_13316, partial [Photinus pyralis]